MDHYSGTYVNGVVMPDSPLPVPENSRVEVVVHPKVVDDRTSESANEFEKRREALDKLFAWIDANPVKGGVIHYTREELHDRN